MCGAYPCECTVITKHDRTDVLVMILQDRLYRLTQGRSVDITVDTKLFDEREFPTLMGLMGTREADSVFWAVRKAFDGYHRPLEGLMLKLNTRAWSGRDDGGYHHEIVFVQDDSEG